jgi:FtsP/CotA-like multicopper oxidase with cupredoxin domain
MRMTTTSNFGGGVQATALVLGLLTAAGGQAAVPGIKGPTFNLDAAPTRLTQPNGKTVYGWGYGCTSTSAQPTFAPAAIDQSKGANCPVAQMPGPTLIVTEGDPVTIVLTNNLPAAAGNTSMLFPGFQVTSSGGSHSGSPESRVLQQRSGMQYGDLHVYRQLGRHPFLLQRHAR